MPLTVLEAASFATPIVVSDIAPHVEVLQGAGPGRRMFRSGDVHSLAATLTAVLDNPEPERLGAQEVRDRVLADHSWDRVTDATEDVYRELVRQRQGRRVAITNRETARVGGGLTAQSDPQPATDKPAPHAAHR
jgi:glycosyltransferase involved in cell wall biosynthesis